MTFDFVQMADPQFGMFAHISTYTDVDIEERRSNGVLMRKAPAPITGFEDETRLYTAAIEEANRIRPAFVVVCGDMVHDYMNQTQVEELFRVTSLLDDDIPIHFVAGNHDVGESPTSDSLALYRERFGADNYSFDCEESHFTVIDSSVAVDPSNVGREWERILEFLADDLNTARLRGARHIVLFTHHPLFTQHADEGDSEWTIPRERREPILAILRNCGVSAVFAGHMHKNSYASDRGLMMVTTGAVGYPLGEDPSGLRVVRVGESIRHGYRALGTMDENPSTAIVRSIPPLSKLSP